MIYCRLIKPVALTIALAAVSFTTPPAVAAEYANPHMLTSGDMLERIMNDPDVRIVDVRPAKAYGKGHIPNAVHLGADDIVDASSPIKGELLPQDKLVRMLEQRGIGNDTRVVLYDDRGGFHAARLFWLLEYFGHRKVSILNGGYPKWRAEKRRTTTGVRDVQPATFTVARIHRKSASADWLMDRRHDSSVVVIDVRPPKLFKAGHIPWAKNIPWARNIRSDGSLKSADTLLKQFAAQGVTKEKNIAVHCQVGKAAAHSYFALRLLGFSRVRSYDRSWAEWGTADDLPKVMGTRG